ncbi:MAG: hypothetical protein IPM93_15790 [Candidatus Obscuribacter sp.]|nr:hypothetical protein [Candidatus Obscuribacter sp.]
MLASLELRQQEACRAGKWDEVKRVRKEITEEKKEREVRSKIDGRQNIMHLAIIMIAVLFLCLVFGDPIWVKEKNIFPWFTHVLTFVLGFYFQKKEVEPDTEAVPTASVEEMACEYDDIRIAPAARSSEGQSEL